MRHESGVRGQGSWSLALTLTLTRSGNGSPAHASHARVATSTPTKGFPEYPNVYPGLTALQAWGDVGEM